MSGLLDAHSERALVLAPHGRDADVAQALQKQGYDRAALPKPGEWQFRSGVEERGTTGDCRR